MVTRVAGSGPARKCRVAGFIASAIVAMLLCGICGCSRGSEGLRASTIEFIPGEIVATQESAINGVVEVMLANRSNTPIAVERLSSNCGCTAAEQTTPGPISPGGAAKVRLSLSIPAFGDQHSAVTAHLAGSGAVAATLRLTLRGKAVEPPAVWAAPTTVLLTGEKPSEIAVREFPLTTLEAVGTPQWVTGLTMPDDVDWLTVEVRGPPTEVGFGSTAVLRTYQLVLRGRLPDASNSPLYADLGIATTTTAMKPSPTVATVIRTEPSVHFAPSELVIPIASDASELIKKTAAFFAPDELAASLRCDSERLPGWLFVEIRKATGTAHAVVDVAIDPIAWHRDDQRDAVPLSFSSGTVTPISTTLLIRCRAIESD
jgi:hypothetical protein